jgi:hypothetical protein
MAKVPVYDQPQVDPSPLHAPDLRSVVSPDLLGAGAEQQQALGKGLVSAGVGATAIAMHIQDRENADMVFRAETDLKDSFIKQEQDWQKNRQGRFAKDLTQDAETWWNENTKKHSDTLANPEQRRIFEKRAATIRQSSQHWASQFEAQQLERSHDESWEASKNTSISIAAQTPTPESVARARLDLEGMNRRQAARKGWEPERLAAQQLADTTVLHESVIRNMAVNDPAGAAAYFEVNKKEIDGKRWDEVGKFAKDVSANAIGDQAAEAIWHLGGSPGDNDPVNLDEMEKQAREALKDNPPALKAAISSLRERTAAHDKGVSERAAANAAAVAQADMAGQSVTAIRAMPEFQALDGTKQAAMLDHIENSRYTRGQRSRQALDQAEQDRWKKNNAAYLQYSDPKVLTDMSRNEVTALLPELGRQYTEHLTNKWEEIHKDKQGKLIEAKMDQDDFNHVAEGAGLKPFDPKKSESEKAALGELKYRIEQRIDREQAGLKRVLTRQEKMQVFTQEMDNKVLVDEWGRDPTKPMILLNDDDLQKAYVTVGGQTVYLKNIPPEDRAAIIEGRQKRGLPVTERDIAQTWLKAGGKEKPASGDRSSSSSWSDVVDYAKKSGMAIAAGIPAANAAIWGELEAALGIAAVGLGYNDIPPTGPLKATETWLQDRRHGQEELTKKMTPESESFVEQSIYSGLTSFGQNALLLPLAVLTRNPNMSLVPMAGMTGGQAYGEARDAQAVPKAARTEIEAALKQSQLPVTERNIRLLYQAYLEAKRRER